MASVLVQLLNLLEQYWGCSSVVDYMLSINKSLDSISSTRKYNLKKGTFILFLDVPCACMHSLSSLLEF